jgi:steroid delta-isomerase-like uncharacterized protein
MTDLERNLGHRWFEEVWNQGRREAIAELFAIDGVLHEGEADARGPEGFYPLFDRIHGTLSELHVHIHHTMAAGDQICVRWSCTGKHTGWALGIPPTGKAIHVTGITILRVAGGKLVEGWQNWDMLGLLEQIRGGQKSATYVGA